MELLVLVWRQYRWPFISVMALSLASAALGIGLIAFINQRLIETADTSLLVLPEFLGLLLLLMAVTLGSQLALTTLGHHFVYRLRSEFIKRILDTHVERIEQLGSASLLAGLTSDVRNITIAFVRLPELVQGIILTYLQDDLIHDQTFHDLVAQRRVIRKLLPCLSSVQFYRLH